MTTVGRILAGAFARRNPNVVDRLAAVKELCRELSDYMRDLSVRVAAVNPAFFGTWDDVSPDEEAWEQPDNAARTYMASLVDGDGVEGAEVNLLEARDRLRAAAPPRLYQVGRFWYSPQEAADEEVGLLADPNPADASLGGDIIRFYYGMIFPELDLELERDALLEVELDEAWRPRHDSLLKDRLCLYMASKDRDATDREFWQGKVAAGEAVLFAEATLEAFEKATRHTHRPRP